MSSIEAIRRWGYCGFLLVVSSVFGLPAFSAEGEVQLRWDPAQRAEGYYVQRSASAGGPYTTVSSRLTEVAFIDRGLHVGTSYYYVVFAANSNGTSPRSNEVRAIPLGGTGLVAPTGLSATADEGSVYLDWDDNPESNLFAYHVFRSTTSSGPFDPVRDFVTRSEYTDREVLDGASYYYVVTAVDTALEQSPPSNVAGVAMSSGSGWQSQDIGGVATAGVFVDLNSGTLMIAGEGRDIWGTSDEFFYTYRALDGDGEISGRVITLQNTHDSAKAGFMMREGLSPDSKNVFMCLTPRSGAILQLRSSTGGNSVALARPPRLLPHHLRLRRSGNTFTAYSSTDGESWSKAGSTTVPMSRRILVGMAVTSHSTGTLSAAWFDGVAGPSNAAPPDANPPAAPSGLRGSAGDAFVDLDWSDNTESDLDGYNVYRGTKIGGPYSLIASAIGSSGFTDSSARNGTTYHYVVTAIDLALNESTYSGPTSVTPRPPSSPAPSPTAPSSTSGGRPAPPLLLTAVGGDGSVVLDWADSTGPGFAGYRVYRSTSTGAPYFRRADGLLTSTYTDVAVTNGTRYYYTITALDDASLESDYSNELSATPVAGSAAPPATTSGKVNIVAQAEDSVVVGARVVRDDPAVPGIDFVDFVGATGDYIEWTVSVPAAGTYKLGFRYALLFGERPLRLLVNGSVVESSLSFPATGSWTTWDTISTTATLRSGTNAVRIVAIGSSGGNVDYLRVTN